MKHVLLLQDMCRGQRSKSRLAAQSVALPTPYALLSDAASAHGVDRPPLLGVQEKAARAREVQDGAEQILRHHYSF